MCVRKGAREFEADWQRTESTHLCAWNGWFSLGLDAVHIPCQLLGITLQREVGTGCAFVASVRGRSSLPIQLCHTITFEFLPHVVFVRCTSLHNVFHALPMAKWPSSPNATDGTGAPNMASRCQNQFNSTSCGTKWPSPAVWCFLACVKSFHNCLMDAICVISGWVFEKPGAHCAQAQPCTHRHKLKSGFWTDASLAVVALAFSQRKRYHFIGQPSNTRFLTHRTTHSVQQSWTPARCNSVQSWNYIAKSFVEKKT